MLDANKAVVRRFIEALGKGDVAVLREVMAPELEAVCTGTCFMSATRRYEEILGAAGMLGQITKGGIAMTVLELTAEADRVSAEFEGRSTLVNGTPYNNQYHMLFYLRGGKIVRMKEYMDTLLVEKAFAPLLGKAS